MTLNAPYENAYRLRDWVLTQVEKDGEGFEEQRARADTGSGSLVKQLDKNGNEVGGRHVILMQQRVGHALRRHLYEHLQHRASCDEAVTSHNTLRQWRGCFFYIEVSLNLLQLGVALFTKELLHWRDETVNTGWRVHHCSRVVTSTTAGRIWVVRCCILTLKIEKTSYIA